MPKAQNEAELIADLVERFRVCWEVWPEEIMVKDERRQIGFSLELYGTHEPPVEHPSPGCAHCLDAFTALQKIAAYILPREERPSTYGIEIYDGALHYTAKRRNRPEVVLPIKILHRHEFEQPVDPCEIRCLTEMKQRLRELGAPQGYWSPRTENHR
jgi:hypothetical protein